MSMGTENRTANASGLTSEESRALKERQPKSDENTIVTAIKQLYSCKPESSTYHVYDTDAVFHDPIGLAKGKGSIRAQFDGLAKLFPRADIPKFRLLENPSSLPESTILIDQDVAYYRQADASEPTKTVNSLLTLERNSSGLITKHTEEWDHQRETSSEDGFLGKLNEWRKLATAKVTNVAVGTGDKGTGGAGGTQK